MVEESESRRTNGRGSQHRDQGQELGGLGSDRGVAGGGGAEVQVYDAAETNAAAQPPVATVNVDSQWERHQKNMMNSAPGVKVNQNETLFTVVHKVGRH